MTKVTSIFINYDSYCLPHSKPLFCRSEIHFILTPQAKREKLTLREKSFIALFLVKSKYRQIYVREPLIDRNAILMEHPVQSINSPHDIVANCICTMLVSNIRRLLSFLSNYRVINLPPALGGNALRGGRGTQRDLYDTTTIFPPHRGLGAQ